MQPFEAEYQKLLHEIKVNQIDFDLLNTELRNTRIEVQSAHDRYTELYDFAGSCFITLSENGKILGLNLCCAQLLGKERADLINAQFGSFVTEETKQTYNSFLKSIFQGKSKETCEVILSTQYGLTKFVQLTGVIIVNDEQCTITITDFTEQKKASKKVKENEKKYRGLYDSMKDGVLQTDLYGKIVDCNTALLDMLGYTIEELKKFTYQQLTPWKWHKLEDDIVQKQIIFYGHSDEYEKEYIRKDGSVIPVAVRVWLIKDDQGIPSGMWGIVRDITESKLAEEKLKKNVEELEQFKRLAVGREMKMIELKQKINEFSLQQGLKMPYKLDFLKNSKKIATQKFGKKK
ncbi:MAG: PAS domain S-box protein [Bacteroidota bacterium]